MKKMIKKLGTLSAKQGILKKDYVKCYFLEKKKFKIIKLNFRRENGE